MKRTEVTKKGSKAPPPGSIQQQIEMTGFEGPVPPPELLEKYRQLDETLVDRIFKYAEEEAAHRRAEVEHRRSQEFRLQERLLMDLETERALQRNGQRFVFYLSALGIVGGTIVLVQSPGAWRAMAALAFSPALVQIYNAVLRRSPPQQPRGDQ